MKYKILEQTENNIKIFCLYDDNTYALLDLVGSRELEEILQDAYILTKNKENRQPYSGEEIQDLKDYNPKPKAARLDVDFYSLTGKVFDQFGEKMNVDVTFEVEGTGARIEDGTIIEDVVDTDTSYFIVAKYGDLEERQERIIYAPREVEPSEIEILNKKIELLASENEAKDDLLQEIILQMHQ